MSDERPLGIMEWHTVEAVERIIAERDAARSRLEVAEGRERVMRDALMRIATDWGNRRRKVRCDPYEVAGGALVEADAIEADLARRDAEHAKARDADATEIMRLQGELAEARGDLERSQAETREARELLVRWFYARPARPGEGSLVDDIAAFLGRPGAPPKTATGEAPKRKFYQVSVGNGCWETIGPDVEVTENDDGTLSCRTDGGRTAFESWRVGAETAGTAEEDDHG